MGRFYGTKVKNGDMTMEQVPSYWRMATEAWLAENNAY